MRKLLVLLLSVSLLATGASPASAHAQLTKANPKANSTVYAIPAKINLQFTDDIVELDGGNLITVTAPSGKRIDTGATAVLGNQLSVALKKSTVIGKYTVRYRVISEDGHPITGTFKFSLAKKKN